jgi:hypothetical protein
MSALVRPCADDVVTGEGFDCKASLCNAVQFALGGCCGCHLGLYGKTN